MREVIPYTFYFYNVASILRHNPDIPPGKCIVVGTQEGIYARASRIDSKVGLWHLGMEGPTSAGSIIPVTSMALVLRGASLSNGRL